MTKVKIYGAGSIGNHLAFACRGLDWAVTMVDLDTAALERTRTDIYPARYGAFDEGIRLAAPADVREEAFDVVIVGTPPDSHMKIALDQLDAAPPRVMMIEKPLCPPDLAGCPALLERAGATGTMVGVGYNHTLTKNTVAAEAFLAANDIGAVATIASMTREHWGGIFGAHPWLSGPSDTYLGFTARGGGALGEHSHAINIWQHFAHATGQGRVVEVSAELDFVRDGEADYDRIAQLSLRTESGLLGTVVQDVVTEPARKWLRVTGAAGFVEWEVNADPGHDAIRTRLAGQPVAETLIAKKRPDDFAPEIAHIDDLLAGRATSSPVSLERGLDTMMVIAAALKSAAEGRRVRIDWSRGYGHEALV
jgi:predicted dehydrogenase